MMLGVALDEKKVRGCRLEKKKRQVSTGEWRVSVERHGRHFDGKSRGSGVPGAHGQVAHHRGHVGWSSCE